MIFDQAPQTLLVEPKPAVVSSARALAHDVNNVATALSGYLELIRHDCCRPVEVLKHAEAMADSLRRLARLADSALSAQPIERVHLAEQARWICQSFGGQVEQRHIGLLTELDDRAIVVATAVDVDRVIANLLGNALQAVPDGGIIKLTTAIGPQQQAIFTIADNGGGVDPARADQLFQHSFTTKPDGHGIGLTSVRQTVDKLGGQIRVTNNPGQGLAIELSFPLAAGEG